MRLLSWLAAAIVLVVLAGCGSTPSLSVGGPPRCDRSGDEDQRRAC